MKNPKDTETTLFDAVRANTAGPVEPVRLTEDDGFMFHCHRGVACWNKCCTGADVTLTPNDILRLAARLDMRPREFVKDYTVPAIWEAAGLPVAKLKMTGETGNEGNGLGPCSFVAEEGCTVYEDRPATCRYYPIGFGTFKTKDADDVSDFHFLIKEEHCEGHSEAKSQSVREFRLEQGVEDYDRVNRGWIDILMKMASWKTLGGPQGRDVSPQTKQMFFMVSTDIDGFREFVLHTKFLDTYDIDEDKIALIKENDEALLQLGFDWLKNVMFNEKTLAMKETVLNAAIAKAREEMGAT